MPPKSILDELELAFITLSASGARFHDAQGIPPHDKNGIATVAVVDTARPRGKEVISEWIGPAAEQVLALHPQRFVIYTLLHDGAGLRECENEELVISEVLEMVRNLPPAPGTVDVLLFLDLAFRLRLNEAIADQTLNRGDH